MVISNAVLTLKKLKNQVDWKLLLFLLLFLNVKMEVKVLAIVVIYLLQFNFRFGFSLKNSRLPVFYLLAIAIAVVNWLIIANFTNLNYALVLVTGLGFWLLCILALHQVKLSVDAHDTETINRTIIWFFIINAVISFFNLAVITIDAGFTNPYTYQGMHQKYFLGTGDYIRGLTFDTSTTNAVLNAFGVIYFLTKKNVSMLLLCMAVMLLTGSNFTNMVLVALLILLFIFKSTRNQKSLIAISVMLLVVFMAKISPQNNAYVVENFKRSFHLQANTSTPALVKPKLYLPITLMPDSLLGADQIKWKIAQKYIDSMYVVDHHLSHSQAIAVNRPPKKYPTTDAGRIVLPKPDINTQPFQHVIDTSDYQKHLLGFIDTHKAELPLSGQNQYKLTIPGKILSWQQTFRFMLLHPFRLIAGNGIGNFSSKLAFRATGLGIAGGYPQKYDYISPGFLSNHLDVYLNFFSKKSDLHSLMNKPDSVYDQLFAEYGIVGLTAFLVYYLGFFLRRYKQLTYGIPLLLLLLAVLFIEYWFEQLSILVFFELLLLLNIKETSPKTAVKYAW